MYEGVDTVVLHNELAYEDVLPVGWRPLAQAAGPGCGRRHDRAQCAHPAGVRSHRGAGRRSRRRTTNRLHSADLHAPGSEDEPGAGADGAIACCAAAAAAAGIVIRFNALGARLAKSARRCGSGEQGLLDIYLRESLAQPLTLIANVTQVSADGQVKVAFTPPGEATADLIEKLAFRRHRRQVAGVRQPRRSTGETGITRILG